MTITLTVIGFNLHRHFFDISFAQFESWRAMIFSTGSGFSFNVPLLFSLVIGSIPLLFLIVDKMAKLTSITQKLVSITIIIGFGILFWQLRILYLNKIMQRLLGSEIPETLDVSINLQTLHLEVFLLIGFLVGAVVSILVFKNKKLSK